MHHPSVIAQNPRLILITPPPIDEYRLEETDLVKGITDPRRTAEITKKYADAVRDVGVDLGVAVLDIWSVFMEMAGWKEGDPLVGSKKVARSKVLGRLLADGRLQNEDSMLCVHSLICSAGLHFLPEAYKVVYDRLMALIHDHWPDQYPETLPFVFPTWTEAPR